MTKRKRGLPKVMWLSPSKFVFESPSKMDFSYDDLRELGLYGKKKVLIVAERGQDLRFLEGNSSMPDELCWFCEYGFSPFLLSRGDVSGCLFGNNCGWQKFCESFVPGLTFGQDRNRDMGPRRRKAEEVFSKIFERCDHCLHVAFCEVRRKPHHWKTPCKNFKLTSNSKKIAESERQRRQLCDYIQELKMMEELKHSNPVC
jgi:hypothetical protein